MFSLVNFTEYFLSKFDLIFCDPPFKDENIKKLIDLIFSRDLLNFSTKKVFSVTEIWDTLIEKNNLFGYESKNKFSHVTNLEIYNKLLKDY